MRRAGSGGVRWWVLFLIFGATVVNHIDRQVLSILKPTISSDLGWSEIDYANIVLAFQGAYAIGFVSWGAVMDRIRIKWGTMICVGLWSVAACAHAFVRSAVAFGWCRFFLGFGESGNYPAGIKIVCRWFPIGERALAIGIFNGGANVGAMIAPFLISWLTSEYGWAATFAATGGLGFLWLVLWWVFYDEASAPLQKAPTTPANDDDMRLADAGTVPYSVLLRWPTTWACIVAGGLSVPMAFFYLFWVPDFLAKTHGIRLMALGPPLLLIYASAGLGSVAGGMLSSVLIKRGLTALSARKLAMLASLLCIVPVVLAPRSSNAWAASGLIGLAIAAHQGWVTNLWATISDMIPHRAVASVFGLGGLVGACAGMVMAQMVGHVLDATGSYRAIFLAIPCAYAVSLLVMHLLLPKTPEHL